MVEDETLAAPNQNYYKFHLPWKCRIQLKSSLCSFKWAL